MSRRVRQPKPILLGLALAAVVMVALAAAYRAKPSADHGRPAPAAIADLARNPEAYDGLRVQTTGVVRVFFPGAADEHFVVEHAGQDRVGLRGVSQAMLTPFVGTSVAVDGLVRVEPGFGVAIEVERIVPVASPPASPAPRH